MKLKRGSFILVSILVVMAFLVVGCGKSPETSGQAEDNSWKAVQDRGELIVGLCAQYPPFESINEETKEIEGFDVDLANAIGKELGVKVNIQDAEWEALLGGVSKGDYDVLITCMSRRSAGANINMSDVYYRRDEIIVVKKDNDSIKRRKTLRKVVGVQTAQFRTGSGQSNRIERG